MLLLVFCLFDYSTLFNGLGKITTMCREITSHSYLTKIPLLPQKDFCDIHRLFFTPGEFLFEKMPRNF
jgi:hypothetical protein